MNGDAERAAAPFIRLGEVIREEARKAGLEVLGWDITGPTAGDPLRIHIAVAIDETITAGNPDIDAALAGILAASAEDERREKAAKEQGAIQDLLRDHRKGILGD